MMSTEDVQQLKDIFVLIFERYCDTSGPYRVCELLLRAKGPHIC